MTSASARTAPIHLVGGVNFSTWADLKWSRANTHIATLQAKFREWSASAPVSVEAVLREDRQGIDLIARVPRGIPKHEWSLGLGDALHNLRSAFDAVAWGMAHFNDAKTGSPQARRRPDLRGRKAMGRRREELGERASPRVPGATETDASVHLRAGASNRALNAHELDIQDKHRDILTVHADLHAINLGGSYAYEDPAVQAVPRVEMYPDVQFAISTS
jgi:hypothetical protein